MLESMVNAPSPTRAEASDVANAVFDGSSALMLSAETAVGADPVNVVATMARIAEQADNHFDYDGWAGKLAQLEMARHDEVTDAMTMAAWRAAMETDAAAILCITRTGFTVRSIARFRPQATILGFSSDERTVRQLTLSWGAEPRLLIGSRSSSSLTDRAMEIAREEGHVNRGDLVAVLSGSPATQGRTTDTLRLLRVP
jgi:pyruvate kinase